jgi:hypothetical protein
LRENLPRIERRTSQLEVANSVVTFHEPVPPAQPEPEPVHAAAPAVAAPPPPEPVHEEPAPMAMAAAAAVPSSPAATEPMFDDLEVPAILRSRRRGLIQ